jgi:hypothetical protein
MNMWSNNVDEFIDKHLWLILITVTE